MKKTALLGVGGGGWVCRGHHIGATGRSGSLSQRIVSGMCCIGVRCTLDDMGMACILVKLRQVGLAGPLGSRS